MFRPFLILLAGAALPVFALSESAPPSGWGLTGSTPGDYVLESDAKVVLSGARSAKLASINARTTGFAALMQTARAEPYSGKRIQLTAQVRSSEVLGWAGVWLRADREDGARVALDNMQDRPIKGTSEWREYSVVLDIPEEATALAYGVLLGGAGTVWVDHVALEIVDASVPVTSGSQLGPAKKPLRDEALLASPENLSFEE